MQEEQVSELVPARKSTATPIHNNLRSAVYLPHRCHRQADQVYACSEVQTDLGDFSTFSLKIFERCSASTVRNMGPKQAAAEKRTKEKITIEMKKEIVRKHEDGMRVTDLAREYGRNPSTIGTILKMREKILAMEAAKGVTRIMPNQPAVLEEVELTTICPSPVPVSSFFLAVSCRHPSSISLFCMLHSLPRDFWAVGKQCGSKLF
ncbi:uncharacterized protein LOC132592793 [Zootoca vivipara]|uniref:uncharacterized protein LOC132592793 n=1 Tax=Zootoca vivipara TaxID=8524 RepID=UPI00293BE462|nr:uncharacterized protein LOC132592793 [Zootoca vivipara]